MSLLDEISDELRSKLNALQEAWDASPWAKDKQMCFPVENWLLTIIAAFSTCGQNTPEPWMSDEYWKSRLLQESDILYGHTAGEKSIELRDNPTTSYKVIGQIPTLGIFQFIKNDDGTFVSKNAWYKVLYGGMEGYVSGADIIRDYSPVCCGIENADSSVFAQAAAMLNSDKKSKKVFNRIHLYPSDPNLSIGFQHLASGNERKLFLAIRDNKTAFDDFCKYIVYRLMNDSDDEPSYKWQAANDIAEIERVFPSNSQKAQQTNTEIKSFADAVRNGRISQITADEWLKAIQFFFSEAGVLRAEKTEGPLSGSTRTGLSYWAEKKSVLLKGCQSYLCADLGRPPAKNQKNCGFLNYPTHKYESIEGAKLFQHGDDDPDTFLSGFWFHDIVKDALLLKSVVNLQIEYWKPEFYSPSIDRLKKLLYTNQQEVDVEEKHKDGILCLVSWLNSWKSATFKSSIEGGNVQVTSVLDKKTFSLEIKQLYTEPVLTAPTDIDPTRIEDAKILLLWLLYNQRFREKKAANAEKKEQAKKAEKNKKKDYSNYVRGRMKAIWNLYMRDKWQLRKGLDYPIKTTDITGYTGDKGKV